MVKGIAIDLASRGITVNNIQPGPTLTDTTADYIDSITPAIPPKRVGDPDEIAGLVAYLASGESGYMTGSSLTIDGGMALSAHRGFALGRLTDRPASPLPAFLKGVSHRRTRP